MAEAGANGIRCSRWRPTTILISEAINLCIEHMETHRIGRNSCIDRLEEGKGRDIQGHHDSV